MEFEQLFLHLNRIRNSIAHYLEYDVNEVNKLFIQFAKFIKNTKISYNTESDVEKMKSIVVAICGNTIGIKMGNQKIKKFKEKITNEKHKDNNLIFIEDFKNFK